MASDDEGALMTGVYVGLGILAAVGAGYLVWRYVLSDETKTTARDFVQDSATATRRAVRDAKTRMMP